MVVWEGLSIEVDTVLVTKGPSASLDASEQIQVLFEFLLGQTILANNYVSADGEISSG